MYENIQIHTFKLSLKNNLLQRGRLRYDAWRRSTMVGLIEKGFGRSPAGGTSCSVAPYIYGFISLMVHILVYTMKLRES